MAKRHVMHEVEEKGWDHTKPHRLDKASIKLFKGANVDEVQVTVPAVEPAKPEKPAVQAKPDIQETKVAPAEQAAIQQEKKQQQQQKPKKPKETEAKADVKVDVPPAGE